MDRLKSSGHIHISGERQSKRERVVYYDLLRVIAVFLVVFNHLPGYTVYMTASGAEQWLSCFFTMLTRINVPIFFMVSGALILGKDEDWGTIFRKRILRFALVIFVFEFGFKVFCRLLPTYEAEAFDVGEFIRELLSDYKDGQLFSYWYLYAYLGMLFMLPFLRSVAQRMTRADFYVLLALHFVIAAVIPGADILCSMTGRSGIALSQYFEVSLATARQYFYPMMGYYLDQKFDMARLKKRHIALLTIATVIGIVLSSFCTIYEGASTGTYTENYVQMFDYVTAVWAFVVIKYLFAYRISIQNRILRSIIRWGGVVSFGVYLLDPYLKLAFYNPYELSVQPYLPTLLASVGWCVISLLLGGAITYGLKKLPLIKRLI